MQVIRVVVMEESAGEHKVWVAQALEMDIATQGSPGDTPLQVVEDLGVMFDARDQITKKYAEDGVEVMQPPPAPSDYETLWLEGVSLGEHSLGAERKADVRQGTWHRSSAD